MAGASNLAGAGGAPAGGSSGRGGQGTAGVPPVGDSGAAGASPMESDASADAGPVVDAGVADSGPGLPACSPRGELCDGIDNDCDGVVDPAGTCPVACDGFALDGRGYMFCSEQVDRGISLARCGAEQMRLAWIETAGENTALTAGLAALDADPESGELLVQIGASDEQDEGEWSWVGNEAVPGGFPFWEGESGDDDGEAVGGAYQSWANEEPNDDGDGEDCGVVSVHGSANREPGQWDDRGCEEQIAFVCEVP